MIFNYKVSRFYNDGRSDSYVDSTNFTNGNSSFKKAQKKLCKNIMKEEKRFEPSLQKVEVQILSVNK